MNKLKLLLLIILQFPFVLSQAQIFEGIVMDLETNQPLSFVEVYFEDIHTGTITDKDGAFKIEHLTQKNIHIQFSYIGYKTLHEVINLDSVHKKTFYLEPSHLKLDEVLISASTGKLQRDNIVSIEHKTITELEQSSPITLAEAISNIPGVEQNTTGIGIGKPIIRGLSGNRIVTYSQNIRIENQQWGSEHGLGVGEIGIENVEVIKGPASLLYGSDALGGVLYFVDERYAHHNTMEMFAQTKFLSNTLGSINHAGFKIHKGIFKFNLFGAYSSHADYHRPSSDRVNNTRFNEQNIKSSFGFNTNNWISNIRYSYLKNNFGITEDGAPSNSRKRNFELPFQTIDNHAISLENNFFINDSKLTTVLGYTNNYRREFEDNLDEHALGMRLNTFTYNLKWHTATYRNHYNFVIGSQGMLQKNQNNGEETLIPDAKTTDAGAFALANAEFDNLQFQSGIRFDYRNINTEAFDHVIALNQSYTGVTFSGGAMYKQGKTKYRANISSGFRAPNTSELLSDGVHEGTNRYEKGNANLQNEQATQIDFSIDYSDDHFKFSISPFFNSIKNYIFLSPTGNSIDNNPVFEYLQTNAYLYGGEMGVHWHPHSIHWLHFDSNLSSVFAQDRDKNALPLIPQTKLNTTVSAKFAKKRKISLSNIYLQHIYKFAQNRIGIFETLTPSYHLLNAGVNLQIMTKNNPIDISTGIKNLLNTKYIDHLSRFKPLDIQNQGINFYVDVKVKLSRQIREKG